MSAKQDIVQREDDPFVAMVERLATNKDVDPDKLEKLVDIQMRIMDRNAEAEFNAAMSRVQEKLPTIVKRAQNTHTNSTYAKHEAIAEGIKPIYTAEGFSTSFSQGKAQTKGYMGIDGILSHRAGHSRPYWLELPPDDKGAKGNVNKTALHAAGSTFTYGRRYLTCLMFDVATGDDTDGNLPETGLSEKQEADLRALLDEVPKAVREEFWQRAHVYYEYYEDLKAHRYSTYVKWIESKR